MSQSHSQNVLTAKAALELSQFFGMGGMNPRLYKKSSLCIEHEGKSVRWKELLISFGVERYISGFQFFSRHASKFSIQSYCSSSHHLSVSQQAGDIGFWRTLYIQITSMWKGVFSA